MVLHLFSFTCPYPIILIISIIYSSIITHKKWLSYFNMISLALLCCYYLFVSLSYIDAWIGLIISLIIINSKVSIEIELSRISPSNCRLNAFENKIFESHFKKFIAKEQFKYLFDKGKMIKSKSKFRYSTEAETFDKIYYFASISKKDSVCLKSNDIKLVSIEEDYWIGSVEFLSYQQENIDSNHQKWIVNIDCDSDDCEVCYFEWNKEVIKNIFLYSIDHVLLNAIIMMWNNSNAKIIEELNRNIYREINKIGNYGLNISINKECIKTIASFSNSKDKIRDNDDDMQEPLLSSN